MVPCVFNMLNLIANTHFHKSKTVLQLENKLIL